MDFNNRDNNLYSNHFPNKSQDYQNQNQTQKQNQIENTNTGIINYHTNNQLSLNNNCQMFRDNRLQLRQSEEIIMNTIKDSTKQEVKEVEAAVEKLNTKIKAVLETPQMKQEQVKVEKYQKIMKVSLKNAMEAFNEGVKQIKADTKLSEADKQRYIKLMYDKLLAKLYTPQEIQAFQNMFSNVILIAPNELRNQRSLPPSNRF